MDVKEFQRLLEAEGFALRYGDVGTPYKGAEGSGHSCAGSWDFVAGLLLKVALKLTYLGHAFLVSEQWPPEVRKSISRRSTRTQI